MTTVSQQQLEQLPIHFIIGAGRSGTTLLGAILNAHPHISCTPEVKPVMTFWHHSSKSTLDNSILRDFKQFLRLRYGGKKQENSVYDQTWFEETNRAIDHFSYKNFAKYALLSLNPGGKELAAIKVLIDKNPSYTFVFEDIIKLYPEAKFLVALRDYRAYCLSQKQHRAQTLFSKYLANSHAAVAYFWRLNYAYVHRLQTQYPDKVLLVPYDRIVTDKEQMLRQVCNFVDIPFDNAILRHEEAKSTEKKIRDNTLQANELGDYEVRKKTNVTQATFTNRLQAWQTQLSPNEIAIAEVIAGKTARNWGYVPTQTVGAARRAWIWTSAALPIAFMHLSTTLLMRYYYYLPFGVRQSMIKYLKLRH